jgi:hypothetical protein
MRQTGWRAVFPWERRARIVEGIDFGKDDEIVVPHGYDLVVTVEARKSPALRKAEKQGLKEVPNPNTLTRRR